MEQLVQFLSDNLIVILIAIAGMKSDKYFTLFYLLGIMIWGNNIVWNIISFILIILAIIMDAKKISNKKAEQQKEKPVFHKWDM